jgi:hypothetical protein
MMRPGCRAARAGLTSGRGALTWSRSWTWATTLACSTSPGRVWRLLWNCYVEAQLFLNDNLLNRSCYFNFVGVKNIEKNRIRQRH